jgi:hypothetical protein
MAPVLVQGSQNPSHAPGQAVEQADEHCHFLAGLAEFAILAQTKSVI